MDNIIKANEKRERLYKRISFGGFYLFILTGIIGCSVIDSCSYTFGFAFVILGILVDYVATKLKDKLKESRGALTMRKLGEDDLRGLKKEELEQLRFHIYAKNGYNFNVNDGLSYLEIVYNKFNSVFPNYKFKKEPIPMDQTCNIIRCSEGQLLFVLENYNEIKTWKNIGELSDERKNLLRERIDYLDFDNKQWKVGLFNRNGEYGHEGIHYYEFDHCVWYKPTTCNLEEVFSKMSDIEKYNVEFIKVHETKLND